MRSADREHSSQPEWQSIESPEPPQRGEEFNLRTDSQYNGAGQLTASIDELGQANSYGYDELGRQVLVLTRSAKSPAPSTTRPGTASARWMPTAWQRTMN